MFKSFAFVLLTFSSICLAGSGFEYGGLSLNSDQSTYKKRYPTSIVQGNSAWLSKADSHNGVHYIEKRSIDGKQEIKISFEAPEDQLDKKPTSWEEGHYARHPKCEEILSQLVKTYKQPIKERPSVEERINHRIRTWVNPQETMVLDCYNIDGQGEFLANEITIRSRKVVP